MCNVCKPLREETNPLTRREMANNSPWPLAAANESYYWWPHPPSAAEVLSNAVAPQSYKLIRGVNGDWYLERVMSGDILGRVSSLKLHNGKEIKFIDPR